MTTTFDKPYASKIELVTRHTGWASITRWCKASTCSPPVDLGWRRHIPFDYRVYDKVQTGTAKKVFELVATDGDIEYWATDELCLWVSLRRFFPRRVCLGHRVLSPRASSSSAASKSHKPVSVWHNAITSASSCLACSLRRIERHAFITGILSFASKLSIVRHAVRAYLASPLYSLSNLTT